MGQLTAEQLNALSVQFLAIGKAILAYRMSNDLGDRDAELEDLQNQILEKAAELATHSAVEAGDEAADAIAGLSGVTGQITATIQKLTDIQKAIDIATSALKVVVSVVSLDPGGIVEGADDLATNCNIKI